MNQRTRDVFEGVTNMIVRTMRQAADQGQRILPKRTAAFVLRTGQVGIYDLDEISEKIPPHMTLMAQVAGFEVQPMMIVDSIVAAVIKAMREKPTLPTDCQVVGVIVTAAFHEMPAEDFPGGRALVVEAQDEDGAFARTAVELIDDGDEDKPIRIGTIHDDYRTDQPRAGADNYWHWG